MEQTSVQKLAHVLRVMVIVVFGCNIIALFLVPGLVGIWAEGGAAAFLGIDPAAERSLLRTAVLFFAVCAQFLWRIWRCGESCVTLCLFLLSCGACTAVVLWQGKRVLDTILTGDPFVLDNAKSMKRAAVCCFLISGAAFVRLIWGLAYYQSVAPLLTYNALFVPIFLMAGLLCMVMSALFRQAAELKAENDLTI
ncbi:MAG: DUF2975 domain-containing protein [Oscillospiraceae bacterium]|nr:DUF2975 domain-containing protein [Oscillospiraceae bacterium]